MPRGYARAGGAKRGRAGGRVLQQPAQTGASRSTLGPCRLPSSSASPLPRSSASRWCSRSTTSRPTASFAVVTRRAVEGEDYVSHLWVVAVPEGGEPRRLTDGRVRDRRPAISPDGGRVAFTRKIPGEKRASLLVARVEGDAAPARLDLGELDPGHPVWSPDGRLIAFTADTGPQRFVIGEQPVKADGTKPEPTARVVTVMDYRWDETGYVDQHAQLFVVAADGRSAPRQATAIAGGVVGIPAWRPDGRALAFTADPRPDADRRPRSSIFEVPADGGEPREVLALAGPVRAPAYSPDGRFLAGIGVDDPDFFDDLAPTLHAGPSDGSARPWSLAPDLDRPIGNWADSDLTGWMVDQQPGPGVGDARRGGRPGLGPRANAPVALPRRPCHRAAGRRPAACRPRRRDGEHARRQRRRRRHRHRHRRLPPAGALPRRRAMAGCGRSRRWAVRGSTASPGRRCGSSRRPGRAGRSRRGSPRRPAPRTCRCPTVVDVHGGPARRVGAGAEPRGRAAVRPGLSAWSCPTSAAPPRTAGSGSRRSWASGAAPDADDVHAALDHVDRARPGRSRPARRLGPLVRRVHGELARGHNGPLQGGGVRERRDQPGQRVGRQRHRARVLPGGADGRPHHARRASSSSGASRRCATWRASARRC